ncbi:MAG: HepT-like ribonuclease domain-containing protein [Egibacteraceae bacterium]
MRGDVERLCDILEAIERIERHTAGGHMAFQYNELIQVWVVRHLQVIGEAAGRLSEDIRARHPDVPWRSMIGMRNVIVHGYFHIDLDAVWSVVEHELGKLKTAVESILASNPDAGGSSTEETLG